MQQEFEERQQECDYHLRICRQSGCDTDSAYFCRRKAEDGPAVLTLTGS